MLTHSHAPEGRSVVLFILSLYISLGMGIPLLKATLLGEIASAFHSETKMKKVLATVQLFNQLKEDL